VLLIGVEGYLRGREEGELGLKLRENVQMNEDTTLEGIPRARMPKRYRAENIVVRDSLKIRY
jgi:hypothetical protein